MIVAPRRYLSLANIGEALGVTASAVSKWRDRYPPDSAHPFPLPDVTVGDVPGWEPSRLPEIKRWRAGMPGRGAGGGRPRKPQSVE